MSAAFRQRLQLSDIYEAARTERNFDYVYWSNVAIDIIVNYMIKQFGYFLVFMACVLITVLVASGFLIVLPAVTVPGTFTYYFHRIFGKVSLSFRSLYYFFDVTMIYFYLRCLRFVLHRILLLFRSHHEARHSLRLCR